MPTIRALTLHIPHGSINTTEIAELIRKLSLCMEKEGLKAWTLRAIVDLERETCEDRIAVASRFCSLAKNNVLVHVGALREQCSLAELLSLCENIFASMVCRDRSCLTNVFKKLWSEQLEVDMYTRFAVLVGGEVRTAYFPATVVAREPSIYTAYRYVDAAISWDISDIVNWFSAVNKKLEKIVKNCLGNSIERIVHDLSLSPWMSESVVEVVEKKYGVKIPEPGSISAIQGVNEWILSLAEKLERRGLEIEGFNETMFAVAEDNVLNEYVRIGRVKLHDLIAFASYCVAGVDMVAAPYSLDPVTIASDLWTVYRLKKKPLGARILPVKAEPGSKIELKRFGTTWVARP